MRSAAPGPARRGGDGGPPAPERHASAARAAGDPGERANLPPGTSVSGAGLPPRHPQPDGTLRKLLLALGINAAALWAAAELVAGIRLGDRFEEVVVVAAIFALVNAFIRPVVKFFAFPVILLTLGLFTLVINAGMLMLADWLADGLVVAGFTSALLGSVIISFVSVVLGSILDVKGKRRK